MTTELVMRLRASLPDIIAYTFLGGALIVYGTDLVLQTWMLAHGYSCCCR